MIHDDDVGKQSELFDAAINDKAAAIICDNASSNATVIPAKKAREAGIPTFMIDREITEKDIAISQIVADNYQGAKGIAEVFVEAMGALTAIKNAGFQGKIIVIGLDGSDDAAAIKNGTMLGTALQQAKTISETAVEQADTYLKSDKTGKDEKQLVDCIIITKANVDKLKTFVYMP